MLSSTSFRITFALLTVLTITRSIFSDTPPLDDSAPLVWLDDYAEARKQAMQSRSMLLIYFYTPTRSAAQVAFEDKTLSDPTIQRLCQEHVILKIPTDNRLVVDGKEITLLSHDAFRHMRGLAGLTIIDYENVDQPYYERIVGCLPFEASAYYAPPYHGKQSVEAFLQLPAGTLTQRMLTFAVRLHPEGPQSANGSAHKILLDAARRHSRHQARIRLQGHHNWGSRFHKIHGRLGGQPPVEVCAESWPGKTLVAACFDCVHSWRQSSGHWNAVSGSHTFYGYDIRKGSNNIWYATGIFGDG